MTKPEPKLTHMPEHIQQLIVDRSDSKTKKSVGFLSKDFHDFVKKSPMEYYCLSLMINISQVDVVALSDISNRMFTMEFHPHERGALMRNRTSKWEKILEGEDYRKAAAHYFLAFFNHPKTKVEIQRIDFYKGYIRASIHRDPDTTKFEANRNVVFDEMHTILKRFRFPLLVETIDFSCKVSEVHILQILPYLKPGTLRTINLNFSFPCYMDNAARPNLDLTAVVETDQWKQAERLLANSYKTNLLLEKWTHARKVTLMWTEPMATLKNVVETFINTPKLQKLDIEFNGSWDETDFVDYIVPLAGDYKSHSICVVLPSEPGFYIGMDYSSTMITIERNKDQLY